MRQHRGVLKALLVVFVLMPVWQGAFAQSVIFVDQSSTGSNTGLSWADAFVHLQDALAITQLGDEVWVAHGVYRPDQGGGVLPGNRDTSFVLPSGVSLYGGFSGTESSREDRDFSVYKSILSGDLLGNDAGPLQFDNPLRRDNSRHVVFLDSPTEAIAIDGFTISGGFVDEDSPAGGSAVLFQNYSVPATTLRILNSHVTENVSLYGTVRVIASYDATDMSLILSSSTINSNWAQTGAGIQSRNARILIDDSVISENSSVTGSAVHAFGSEFYITRSTFAFNTSESHGAIYMRGENSGLLSIWSSRFVGNKSTRFGPGVVHLNESHLVSINNIFSGNTAASEGGALVLGYHTALIVNNVFAFNSAGDQGGAIQSYGQHTLIANSIFWENSAPNGPHIHSEIGDSIRVSNTIANGGIGEDTIDDGVVWNWDPQFVDADGPDDISGTLDDDFRLTFGSPAIDAGDDSLLPFDSLDLDEDGDITELLPGDILGHERMFNGGSGYSTVDLGVFEYGAPPIDTRVESSDYLDLPRPAALVAFPNPARHFIHIQLQGRPGSVELLLFDILGRYSGRLFKGRVERDVTLRVALPEIAPGVYIIYDSQSGLSVPVVVTK